MSTEPYPVLVSYDLSRKKHGKFKEAMKEKGYLDYFMYNNETYYLPNTTLWNPKKTTASALKDVDDVIRDINRPLATSEKIRLERVIAVRFTEDWNAIPGDPHDEA